MTLHVIKRDGSKEPLNIDKLHKVMLWATEGLAGVSASEVELKSQIQFYNNIKSADIHETMIKAAAELISETSPNYQYVAGRLINYHLRKEVYGLFTPCHVYDLILKNVGIGLYDKDLLNLYTKEEWNKINKFIDHDRDMSMTYAGMEQLRGKYLLQNRVTKSLHETPQMAYIIIAATIFGKYPQDTRMSYVKDFYDAISKFYISLPTPIMAGVRTPQRQYASCTLIECDDTLDSISATTDAIVKYVSQKAGIGIGAGRIRALGSSIRKGDATHTGVTPFYKLFQAAVSSCSQGAIRKGSATLNYPIYHLEIEDMLVLKNNKGTEENRVRHMDYCVQFNKLFYERLITGGDITLFSPNDVTEMYEAFFTDYDRFKVLYETAEKNTKIRKKRVKASDLFSAFVQERKDTGRIYLSNVDNVNTHSSFIEKVAPVRMTNLCAEISICTTPMATKKISNKKVQKSELSQYVQGLSADGGKVQNIIENDSGYDLTIEEDMSRIALCTLAAINWGLIKQPSDFELPCKLAVRALDALLDYQDYPVIAAKKATMEYRPLGIGIINLAYWLAKNDLKYSDNSALPLLDEYAEAWSYYIIKASIDLAKEKGPCLLNQNTKYSLGVMPIDTRKKDVDTLVPHVERMDWDTLRQDAKMYGIRNATTTALMPSETSSQLSNATNGIEPPRAYVSVKISKDGVLRQIVPEYKRLKNKYELLWDQKSPMGYLNICAVLQKYIDQAISVNTSYNPKFYPDDKIPMSEMLSHILSFYKMGGKNLYYNNTNDQSGEIDIETLGGTNLSTDDDDCESCKI